jgi:hypothetical protein
VSGRAAAKPAAAPVFSLDEQHVYRLGDRVLPGTTTVLSVLGMLPDYSGLDPYFRERGSAVHAAISIAVGGQEVDWDFPGSDDVRPRVERALKWLSDVEFTPLWIEQPAYCPTYLYAGTPDIFGYALAPDGNQQLVLPDWKSGAIEPGHDIQVAGAYLPLLEHAAATGELLNPDGSRIKAEAMAGAQCCVISLAPEIPLVHWVQDIPQQRDIFRAALACFNWRAAHMRQ